MTEIDWKQDYQGEFTCPYCNEGRMSLGGFNRGKRNFVCKDCQRQTVSSINLNRRSLFLELRLKDEQVDWEKDYQGEFICPECQVLGMSAWGIQKLTNKRQFHCFTCRKSCL